jgi:hypothetical protein
LRRSLCAAVLAATVLIIAAPAGAATLDGHILGRPQIDGLHARVPVLLADGAGVVLTVPAKSGFRTATTGRTSADRTRLGDAVSATVRRVRDGRASAKYLKIAKRSAAPAFGDLDAGLASSSEGVKQAAAEVAAITAAEAGGPQDPAKLRGYLLTLRYRLNLLIVGLRSQAAGMDRVKQTLSELPKAGQLSGQLTGAATGARSAATKLEDGVTGLDEFINAIGGTGGEPLPVGGVGEVGQILTTAEQILDGLDPQDGLPGAPTLPDPLGGVPVPVVPVLPG